MGKFFAAVILASSVVWLAPMCARVSLPESAPAVTVVSPPVEETVPAPEPAVPPKPAPANPLTAAPYRMKKMFPVADGKCLVSVLRRNASGSAAVDIRMTVTALERGEVVEQARSYVAQTLAAGTTSYAGLNLSAAVIDRLLTGPEEVGTELKWTTTYRLEGEPADATRCYTVRALPRPRQPEGVLWKPLGLSTTCP